jgi:hypothetical protein
MGLALLVLLTFFVFIPVVLFFSLRWVALRWLRTRPDHPLAAKVMPSAVVVPSSGGALLPTPSRAAAAAAAQAITSEASNSGYPLVCRAVHVD